MTFKQLTLLAEDDFMAGVNNYEDMHMKVYVYETLTDTGMKCHLYSYANIRDYLIQDGEVIEDVFAMDEDTLIQQLKAGKCIHGYTSNRAESILICTDKAKIKAKIKAIIGK